MAHFISSPTLPRDFLMGAADRIDVSVELARNASGAARGRARQCPNHLQTSPPGFEEVDQAQPVAAPRGMRRRPKAPQAVLAMKPLAPGGGSDWWRTGPPWLDYEA